MRIFSHHWIKLAIVTLFILLIFEAGILFSSGTPAQAPLEKRSGASLTELAQDMLGKCASSSYHPACFDEEIPKLMDTISMEEAFEVTRFVQDSDSTYRYCHVLGHKLSARETAKDPAKWKDVITRCPSGMCSNGCIHGAFQERFRTDALSQEEIENVKSEFFDVCEARGIWRPTGLEQASCYHALGHLLMYITSADIDKALALCEEVAKRSDGRDFRQLCFDGAFMQIFQPLEPEDFALIEGKQPTKEEHKGFCDRFDPLRQSSCWSEGWPLHREAISTPDGLTAFCTVAQAFDAEGRCYDALFFVLTAQMQFDRSRIDSFCSELSVPQRQGQCFADAAARLIETDYRNISEALVLCQTAQVHGVGEPCFDSLALYATYNFQADSQEAVALCASLPEPWKNKCALGKARP